MKKSLLALLFAVALAVPALAENMWVGGSLGYSNASTKGSTSDYGGSITFATDGTVTSIRIFNKKYHLNSYFLIKLHLFYSCIFPLKYSSEFNFFR